MHQLPPAEQLIAALEQFARDLAGALAPDDLDWHLSERLEEWSLTEVVCHLRDVELEVHQPRLEMMLEEEGAFLAGVVADEWAAERDYSRQDGPRALRDFLAAREETMRLLSGLDDELLQRQAQHAFLGPTTMHELLYLIVQHDEAHGEQISDLLQLQQ